MKNVQWQYPSFEVVQLLKEIKEKFIDWITVCLREKYDSIVQRS